MNKKFSTLLAGLVLASAAAVAAPSNVKLKVGPNDGLYQITTDNLGTKVMVMDANGGLKEEAVANLTTGQSLASSLWCVSVDAYNQGQNPKFDFTNKLYGRVLDINMDDPALVGLPESDLSGQLQVGGNTAGWAFSSTYANGVEKEKPMFSYFKPDSVVYLTVDGSGYVVARKEGANVDVSSDVTLFSLQVPEAVMLNASDLNTLLGTAPNAESFKLNFSKVANPNVFANELVARDTIVAGDRYQLITNKATGKYLRVDTAFNSTTGVRFLQLTDTTSFGAYVAAVQAGNLPNGMHTENYLFSFKYSPASDSVYIDVRGAVLKKNAEYWKDSYFTTAAGTSTPAETDSLHVFVQDLTDDACVLTVGNYTSKVTLGFGTCSAVTTTKTTVPNDLYVIKSTDGKYLAVPIHGDTTTQWVTLEKNVNVWEMPSFQWVVEKKIKSSDISQIKITNREFGTAARQFINVQLDKEEATPVVDENGVSKGVKVDGFIAATAAVKADSLVGYKYLKPQDLQVTRYKFRYLHEFSDEDYVGVNSEENDSILYVGAKSAFSLAVKHPLHKYGYTSSDVDGLKPLYRQSYSLKIRNAKLIYGAEADSVSLDSEGRFSVSKYLHPDTFLLKANYEKAINDVDVPFYAFVKIGAHEGDTTKVGVDDNNLWMKNQVITESRTSAFSVEVDESPLYRRFNTLKEGEEANDKPDTVKFLRVNNPADMLFEDANSVYSQGFGINFLGVSNSVQYPKVNRAIYVDTAYVNRGTGYIKPQYMLALGVNVVPGVDAVACPLDHNHGFDKDGNALDKWTCSHATPGTSGYLRGRYLINTVDSAKINGDYTGSVRDNDYIWNNQVRLAFVEAIHKNDTLYILRGDTAKWADPVDFTKLTNKIRLDNNLHKNVVFSFRLLEEGSDNFLIESAETDGEMIAPMNGGWVKIQNGVPVISYAAFDNAANEAEIFNVEKTAEKPVANESISASGVSVMAKAGAVVVKGAAGKNVIISNVLGQTIANTVLSSDEATISAPAGVVVVAIEGEEAVKAIVK